MHSKDDLARSESISAYHYLSKQCSDPAAIEILLKQVFDIFNGSDGKLTVVDHKYSVLQAAGYLSENSVTGSSSQKLALTACEHFIKVLNVEVHEKTLSFALDMMSMWCKNFNNEVPQKVIDGLKVIKI